MILLLLSKTTGCNRAAATYNSASATRSYWAGEMSYYNTGMAGAAYDIIRSDLADTIAHPDRFTTWMEKLNTYSSAEAMVDYYLQLGDYTTALNKVDSLPYRFTFTAYDSVEYPLYKDFKHKQATWLSDGRTIFDLTTSEINSLIAIADSSKGTAGAQARAILLYAYDTLYTYTDCPEVPGNNKSAKLEGGAGTENDEIQISVMPNPTTGTVTFTFVLPEEVKSAALRMVNTAGKTVLERNINVNTNELRFDCSHLSPGVYYYTLSGNNKKVSGKLLIVR